MPISPISGTDGAEQPVDGKALDLGDVAIEPRQQIAGRPARIEGRRQLLEMAEDREPQREQHIGRQRDVLEAVDAAQQRRGECGAAA